VYVCVCVWVCVHDLLTCVGISTFCNIDVILMDGPFLRDVNQSLRKGDVK
jgi:hypothetical protein